MLTSLLRVNLLQILQGPMEFSDWDHQRLKKWRIFRRIVLELEIPMLTMMMSLLAPGIKACGPIVDIDQVYFAIVDYDSMAHKVLSLENDSPLCSAEHNGE